MTNKETGSSNVVKNPLWVPFLAGIVEIFPHTDYPIQIKIGLKNPDVEKLRTKANHLINISKGGR